MNLIQNIILTNLFIILIYVAYKAGFSRSISFKANRIFLLAGLTAALVLPWISPVMNFLVPANEVQWLSSLPAMEEPVNIAETTVIVPVNPTNPIDLALWSYLSLAGLLILISMVLWARLLILARKAPVHRYKQLKVVVIKQGWTAFSIFRTVFYPKPFEPDLPETKLILEHEGVHARQWHTLDNIFYGSLRLVFFINPFIHLLHKELMITHEYLADRLTSASDRTGYSRILISHQFKVPHFILMHPFNQQSFLKRRLNMLSKNTPNHLAGWKYLLVLPLLAGMILASSWRATAQDKNQKKKTETAAKLEKQLKKLGFEKTGETTWTKDGMTVQAMDNVAMDEINARLQEDEEEKQVFLIVEEMPTFQGGNIEDFRIWVQGNVKYPAEAKEKKISGTEYVSFWVNRKGEVVNINIVRGVNPLLDEEVTRAIKSSPAWTPGIQRGQPVNVSFAIPVKFVLDGTPEDKSKSENIIPDEAEGPLFMVCEEMPEFNGGTLDKFTSWAQANVKYPYKAMEESISGTVEVSFTVNKVGKVVDVSIEKSADPVLDEAVLNVVRSSPTWKPGKQRSRLVNVRQTIPIKFILQ